MQHWAKGLTYAFELEKRGKQKWPNNMFHKTQIPSVVLLLLLNKLSILCCRLILI